MTFGELQAWAAARREAKEPVRWPQSLDDYVGRLLLADEAKRGGLVEPADELQRADAWAKQELLPPAEASITDADMQAAFAERRSAVRVMSRSEAEAKELRQALLEPVAQAATIQDKIRTVRARGGKPQAPQGDDKTLAPQGALFDPQGKGDAGQSVVPPKVAEAAFALKIEGEISEPIEIATSRWVLVMLSGIRPGTPLDKVPPEVATRTREGLVATRAMAAMKERIARLRRDSPVVVLDDRLAQKALGLTAEDLRAARVRKLPFDTRKMRMDQLRGSPQERVPGVERRDAPPVEKVTPERVHEDMKKHEGELPAKTPGGNP
ncbi:MAG: peptidyl-prolyl cis-trans isomerase [Deltaproteobacteria bacterium]|nr:peptidyl-prolyl cis-trans isomerase [Deltaproteobacteria bacterium]